MGDPNKFNSSVEKITTKCFKQNKESSVNVL